MHPRRCWAGGPPSFEGRSVPLSQFSLPSTQEKQCLCHPSLQGPGNGGRAGRRWVAPRQRPPQPHHLRPAWQPWPHGSLLCIRDREGPRRALGWSEATATPGEGKPSDAQVPTLGPPTPKGSSVRSVSHQPLWSLRKPGPEAGQQPCGFGRKMRPSLAVQGLCIHKPAWAPVHTRV